MDFLQDKILPVLDEYTCECLALEVGRSMTSEEVKKTLRLFIQPGYPWENGVVERFNARLRDEVLAQESFWNLLKARVVLEEHRQFYNTKRPHRSLGGMSPEAFTRGTPTDTSPLGVVKAKLTA